MENKKEVDWLIRVYLEYNIINSHTFSDISRTDSHSLQDVTTEDRELS